MSDLRWLPYTDYIFQRKFFELQMKYFPWPIPKDIIKELEEEYANSKGCNIEGENHQ